MEVGGLKPGSGVREARAAQAEGLALVVRHPGGKLQS
jgi:hypothetical protein